MRYQLCISILFVFFNTLISGEVLVARFSQGIQPEKKSEGVDIKWIGKPSMVTGQGLKQGENALFLQDGSYGRIFLDASRQQECTISFWWKSAVASSQKTWSFLYGDWDDKKSYFVLSHGWWDYFNKVFLIFHNYALLGGQCHTEEEVHDGWNFYAVGWKRTEDRVKVIFHFNGLSAERTGKLSRHARLQSPLLFGRDASETHPATGYFRNLVIHDSLLSPESIMGLMAGDTSLDYVKQLEDNQKSGWMKDVKGLAPREKRDSSGRLLESRTAFVEHYPYLASSEKVRKELDRLKQSGYNVAMTQVGYAAPAYQTARYPEARMVKDYRCKYPGRNAYEFFIDEAHKRGLEVHSSFALGYTYAKIAPPEWERYMTPDRTGMNYYDPDFRKMIADLVVSHVQTYDVDGVNLDYVRVMGNGLESEVAAQEYARLYKRNLREDCTVPERMKHFSSRCVGEVVYDIQKRLRTLNRNLVISVACVTQRRQDGLNAEGRNAAYWMEAGWIDCAYSMEYGSILGIKTMDQCRQGSLFPQGYVIGIGNYKHQRMSGGTVKTVSAPRKQWIARLDYLRRKYNDGNGLFTYFWNIIDDDDIVALRQGPFRELALPYWCRQQERQSLDEVFPLPEK